MYRGIFRYEPHINFVNCFAMSTVASHCQVQLRYDAGRSIVFNSQYNSSYWLLVLCFNILTVLHTGIRMEEH